MEYIISSSGKNYVALHSNGGYYLTTDKSKARKLPTKEKAMNVLNSCSKNIKDTETEIIAIEEENLVNTNTELEKEIINNSYVEVNIEDLKASINQLSNQLRLLKGNKQWLVDMQSEIDQKISDVLHYIEFYTFSASEGYMLAKNLKELRLKRRQIKDQLEIISILNTHSCNMIAEGKTNNALVRIENKHYTPRYLVELFEGKQKN